MISLKYSHFQTWGQVDNHLVSLLTKYGENKLKDHQIKPQHVN